MTFKPKSTTYLYRDKAKRREYMKLLMRKRRAKKSSDPLGAGRAQG